ncbi:MAG: ATP-binding protein [Zoogloeaceae bacterium]|nr:ATP-binding protein [Zoogloeaceae bacterium]
MTDWTAFLSRAEALLDRVERLLPQRPEPDWNAQAFRWRTLQGQGFLHGIANTHAIRLEDLQDIDDQKARLDQNTRQFLAGRSANNVLLTGARGTGKSSLVKALLNAYARDGLRLIEVDKADLVDLPDIVDLLRDRPERFILFCDDLSFEEGEAAYKALKSVLDGSLAAVPDNVLIYATSNRRHLMPEFHDENRQTRHVDGEIHPAEAVEEKISLSERFGLWLSFYPFSQNEYLAVVHHWLRTFGVDESRIEAARQDALQWALLRGSRSGRVAWQFAKDFAGRLAEDSASSQP